MRALVLIILVALVGCTHSRWRTEEAQAYVEAQKVAIEQRRPLFELRAQPGQTITLSGVESLVVNDPREQRIDPLPQQRSQALDALLGIVKIGAQVYGAQIAADGIVELVDSVGAHAGDRTVINTIGSHNDQSDRSVQVGGDYTLGDHADTTTTIAGDVIGRDRVDTTIGDGFTGGDRTDVGRDQVGGDWTDNTDGRIGSPGDDRNDSPGPIDDHSSQVPDDE